MGDRHKETLNRRPTKYVLTNETAGEVRGVMNESVLDSTIGDIKRALRSGWDPRYATDVPDHLRNLAEVGVRIHEVDPGGSISRVFNSLGRAGFSEHSMRSVLGRGDEELLSFRNLGKPSVAFLREAFRLPDEE